MFETLGEKAEEKAMVQFLERFSSRIPNIQSERENPHLQ